MRLDGSTTAVITGAASGIGRATALALADRGCSLALLDVDTIGLEVVAAEARTKGVRVSAHCLDIAERDAVSSASEEVAAAHGGANLLINNAGVGVAGPFETVPAGDFEWLMGVNFWGAVNACKSFLPQLRAHAPSNITMILSGFAFYGFPTKSAYCASKFALRGFSEALRAELHGSGVRVSEMYPPAVPTNIVQRSRAWSEEHREIEENFVRKRGMAADVVARRILRGIARDATRTRIGMDTWMIEMATRVSPVGWGGLLARLQRRIPFV